MNRQILKAIRILDHSMQRIEGWQKLPTNEIAGISSDDVLLTKSNILYTRV